MADILQFSARLRESFPLLISSPPPPVRTNRIKRLSWRRVASNIFFLPPVLLYIIVERVFWLGAKSMLHHVVRTRVLLALQERLEHLPASVVLPMFLVPEAFSHAGGFLASALLLRREWVAALVVGVFVKGTAMLMVVWIYQASANKLLSVRWFFRFHEETMACRNWVAERMHPVTEVLRRFVGGRNRNIAARFGEIRNQIPARIRARKE
jgi:hypothetical protein